MTGKFDKPLGVKPPVSKIDFQNYRVPVFALLIVVAVISGFALNSLVSTPSIAPENTVVDTPTQDPTPDTDGPKNDGFIRRPNLPIDDTGPGLSELSVVNQDDIPTIIPKKRPQNTSRRQTLVHLPDSDLIEEINGKKLPRISPDGLRPLDVYARQPTTEGNFGVARIVLIVGGLGISQTSTQQAIESLPAGVTLAFAPYGNSLTRWMEKARKSGHELLLQLPMEPFGYPQTTAGEHSLLSSSTSSQNTEALHWSLGKITNYVGVMNFLGGKMLASPDQLATVFEELSQRGLMFVDDGSIRNSKASSVANITQLPFTKAHATIDDLRTRQAIGKRLKELETLAKRTGLAIGVATAFPETIAQINIFLKNAKGRGLELTPVSAIATQPKG